MSWNRAIVSAGNQAAVQSCCGTINAGGCRKTNDHLSRVGMYLAPEGQGWHDCMQRFAHSPSAHTCLHSARSVRRSTRGLRRWRAPHLAKAAALEARRLRRLRAPQLPSQPNLRRNFGAVVSPTPRHGDARCAQLPAPSGSAAPCKGCGASVGGAPAPAPAGAADAAAIGPAP
jgi:hypothetical protein